MAKLSSLRKRLILEILTITLICAFLATFVMSADNGARVNIPYESHINPFASDNGSLSIAGCVQYTLLLSSNKIVNGNFINAKSNLIPVGTSFDSSNGNLYVADYNISTVSVINATNDKVKCSIQVGLNPVGVAFDNSNGNLYVTNQFSDSVSVIDGKTDSVTSTISVQFQPYGVTFDSANDQVYITDKGSNNVAVINSATNRVVDNISVGSSPYGISFDPDNGNLYVVNDCSNSVSVIDGSTNKVICSITVGTSPIGVAFDSGNGYLYVTNEASNTISVINGATNTVIDTILVGMEPYWASFDSINGYVYVTNSLSNSISVIDVSNNEVISTIDVGETPLGVTFDSSNGYVYVTNALSGTVSIITTKKIVEYPVTFKESNLPLGSEWYVNLSNGMKSGEITGSSYTFKIINGSYRFTIETNNKIYHAENGSFLVKGASVSEPITFSKVLYTVIFTEKGLPSEKVWYVNLSNGMKSGAIRGTFYAFSLTNGTYSYEIGNISGYKTLNSTGTVTVNGKNVKENLIFSDVTSHTDLYIIIGAASVVIITVIAAIVIWRRK